MEFSIKKLCPELLQDYLFFFDNIVFSEHPDWSKCYCYSFHFTGKDEEWNKTANREAVTKLIQENKMRGYMVYSNSTPIGWVNVNNRNNYERLTTIYKLDDNSKEKIASIVCFLIHPDFRRKGIAKLLIAEIIQDYTMAEYDYLEAYPGKDKHSCEKNYKGHLNLYERNNFKTVNEHPGYCIVRKKLK